MKTRILKVVTNSMSLGIIRLTENALGNVNVETAGMPYLSTTASAHLYAAIDAFLVGYQEHAGPSSIWLEAA